MIWFDLAGEDSGVNCGATFGPAGTGFALAAQLARPGEKMLLIHGDGTFGLNGMEFESMVRQQLPIVSIVGNASRVTSNMPTNKG